MAVNARIQKILTKVLGTMDGMVVGPTLQAAGRLTRAELDAVKKAAQEKMDFEAFKKAVSPYPAEWRHSRQEEKQTVEQSRGTEKYVDNGGRRTRDEQEALKKAAQEEMDFEAFKKAVSPYPAEWRHSRQEEKQTVEQNRGTEKYVDNGQKRRSDMEVESTEKTLASNPDGEKTAAPRRIRISSTENEHFKDGGCFYTRIADVRTYELMSLPARRPDFVSPSTSCRERPCAAISLGA